MNDCCLACKTEFEGVCQRDFKHSCHAPEKSWEDTDEKENSLAFLTDLYEREGLVGIKLHYKSFIRQERAALIAEVVEIIKNGGTGDTISTTQHNGETYINERDIIST